jgi:hypothetical protein
MIEFCIPRGLRYGLIRKDVGIHALSFLDLNDRDLEFQNTGSRFQDWNRIFLSVMVHVMSQLFNHFL